MAIQRLKSRSVSDKDVDAFIRKGGETTACVEEKEVRMTLRLPAQLVEQLDSVRRRSPGFISRNSLILRLIQEGLNPTS